MSAFSGGMSMVKQAQRASFEEDRQRQSMWESRRADAQEVLRLVSSYAPQFKTRSPEDYEIELHEWTVQIANTNLTREELLGGVRLHFRQETRGPWVVVGNVLEQAREYRRSMQRGSVVRELRALPPAAPSAGPVAGAYDGSIAMECPKCGAGVGRPCVSERTHAPKRMPCVDRLVLSRREGLLG